jgi:hypothetical protein
MKKVTVRVEVNVFKPGDIIPANTDVADRTGKYFRWQQDMRADRTYVQGMIPFHFVWDGVTRQARQNERLDSSASTVDDLQFQVDDLQGEINDVATWLAKRGFNVDIKNRTLLSNVVDVVRSLQDKRNVVARETADVRDEFASARINWEREKESLLEEIDEYKELLKAIWLYVKWYYVTKQLTTEQKDLWANAIDEKGDPEDGGSTAERWWEHD